MNAAILGGNLPILKEFYERSKLSKLDVSICAKLAASGNIEALKWAREVGFPWKENTCSEAAKHGHLSILKWARENGCPWDLSTACSALDNGHVDLFKWAFLNGVNVCHRHLGKHLKTNKELAYWVKCSPRK